jgi:NTP pyrophosphatase (non-canonical NTP hydrolase)
MQRNWAQFHSLRNLIVSLNLEAAELLELTQWKSDAEVAALPASAASREALRDECADVLLYLLLIAERAGIDLEEAAHAPSCCKNAARYPVGPATAAAASTTSCRPTTRRPAHSRLHGASPSSVKAAPASTASTCRSHGSDFLQGRLQRPRRIDHEQAAAVHAEAIGWPASARAG